MVCNFTQSPLVPNRERLFSQIS